jgi:hypothetical protein
MPTGILRFKLPEEEVEFELAQRASDLNGAISDISNEVFRPARKHGYGDEEITELIKKLGESDACALIGLLEKKFISILEDRDILHFE